MCDSVPKHTGPISLTDTPLEPSISRTRPTILRVNSEMGSLFPREAQAVCRCNCWGAKLTPFFQMVKVRVTIFRARVRRAIVGRIPLATRAT